MKKYWFVFTLFMTGLGFFCLGAYIFLEIKGYPMGLFNWIALIAGTIAWCSLTVNAFNN